MGRTAVATIIVGIGCVLATSALAVTRAGSGHGDRLVGSPRADLLAGKRGGDLLIGGRGPDVLLGGPGPDVLRGGPGSDEFNFRKGTPAGSGGADKIDARDGTADRINCGAGRDTAIVDEVEDGVYDCERVVEP